MKPFYLKFTDEAEAADQLAAYRFTDEDGAEQWKTASLTHALDVVGAIAVGGKWDEEGNEIEAPTVLDGYHVNLMIGELPAELAPYIVTPTTPSRVFAGV